MMQSNQDLELLRDIPGYKAILKALIKSQIQHLVEQLSTHTEEEAVLLTASITDGSLSHLGSASGKVFLDKNEDIKSKFLGFCLKRHHQTQPTPETEPQNVYQNTSDSIPPTSQHSIPQKRQWSHYRNSTFPYQHPTRQRQFQLKNTANQSVPMSMATNLTSTVGSNNSQGEGHASQEHQVQVQGQTLESENVTIKSENLQRQTDVENIDTYNSTNTSLNISSIDQSNHAPEIASNENDASQLASIKVEAVTEEDLELEITGVEMAEGSQMNLDWSSMTDNSQAAASGQSYGKAKRPMSSSERQRKFRERRNQDAQKREKYLKQQKEKYRRDRKLGKIKSIKEMTPKERAIERERWRHSKQKHRGLKKATDIVASLDNKFFKEHPDIKIVLNNKIEPVSDQSE